MIVKIKNTENGMEKMQESIKEDLEELKNKHTETTQLLKLKILQKETIAEKRKQKNEISELEDKMMEITSEEHNKVIRIKRTEDSLRDLWDNIKHTNIRIIGVQKKRKRRDIRKNF